MLLKNEIIMDNLNDPPLISVIVLNYNGKEFVNDCLCSVLKTEYNNFEVILVDNSSTDKSFELALEKFGCDLHLRVVKNYKNLFFAEGNNRGIREARGEYVVILNNDTVVTPSWLTEIVLGMRDKTIGAAQPKILLYNDPLRIDYAGTDLDKYGYAKGRGRGEVDRGQFDNTIDIFYAGGTAMVLRKKVLNEVGLFDDKFGAHWEDVDLSWRIRLRGYKIVLIPKAVIYHKGSKTMSKFAKRQEVAWYIRKNRIAGLIKNYNIVNLIKTLPILILIYFLFFIKELFVNRDIKIAMASILAVIWNIKELPYILRARWRVQRKIRRISDSQILKFMQPGSMVFQAMCLYMEKNAMFESKKLNRDCSEKTRN